MKNLRAAIASFLPAFRSVTCYWIAMSAVAMCAALVLDASAASGLLPRHGMFGAALHDSHGGATITRVIPNSAAAKAGIEAGDIIVELDGVATPKVADFLAEVHQLHAGQRVALTISRHGVTRHRVVVLGAPANERDPAVRTIYGSVEVGGSLRRTLTTVPNGSAKRLPGVLLIGGIGCFSVDAANNPQDGYMRLTHDISKAGFVTMRLEKSGVGDSQGPPCHTVDFHSEEQSYALALSALCRDPHVDASRIYLLGHSIGSIEAPRLAVAQAIKGLIVLEAIGRDWPEYEIRNSRRQLELGGDPPAKVDAALIEKDECLVRLLFEKQPEDAIERSIPSCKEHNRVYPVDAPYMQQVATVNVIDVWTHVNVPALVVYGRSDFVTEEADHVRIVNLLNAQRPGSASLAVLDDMDHFLARAATPKASLDALESGSPRQYDTDLSRVVVTWLCKRERCTS